MDIFHSHVLLAGSVQLAESFRVDLSSLFGLEWNLLVGIILDLVVWHLWMTPPLIGEGDIFTTKCYLWDCYLVCISLDRIIAIISLCSLTQLNEVSASIPVHVQREFYELSGLLPASVLNSLRVLPKPLRTKDSRS